MTLPVCANVVLRPSSTACRNVPCSPTRNAAATLFPCPGANAWNAPNSPAVSRSIPSPKFVSNSAFGPRASSSVRKLSSGFSSTAVPSAIGSLFGSGVGRTFSSGLRTSHTAPDSPSKLRSSNAKLFSATPPAGCHAARNTNRNLAWSRSCSTSILVVRNASGALPSLASSAAAMRGAIFSQ